MIQQVRQMRSTDGARAFAVALIAASLVVLAGVGGYEVGTFTAPTHAAASTAPAGAGQEAPPVTGLQP